MVRTCSKCGTTGEEGAAFYRGQGNTCRECANKSKRQWQKEVRAEGGERHERRKEQLRVSQAKSKYGLTSEQARALYAIDACQICGTEVQERRINIDHCHKTKMVRGVLCNRCNRGLGFFLDSAELLEAAAHYIRNPPIPNIKEHSALGDRPASLGPVSHGAESD